MIKQPKDRQLTRQELIEIACELESMVKWALNFLKPPPGSSGMMVQWDGKGMPGKSQHWTQWFADGVEALGHYKVDRELLGLNKKEMDAVLKRRKQAKKQDPKL